MVRESGERRKWGAICTMPWPCALLPESASFTKGLQDAVYHYQQKISKFNIYFFKLTIIKIGLLAFLRPFTSNFSSFFLSGYLGTDSLNSQLKERF
jgi:hypothetical protein